MLLLEMFCGLRMGEIAALPATEIKKVLNWNTLSVTRTLTRDKDYKTVLGDTTKTYAGQRIIKLDEITSRVLNKYINECYKPNKLGLLFVNKNGGMISTGAINSYYKRLIHRYNICNNDECNQHQLRHTYATRCIESGMPAKILQKRLGHKDIQTTLNTYCDVFEAFEQEYINKTQEYYKEQCIAI